MKRKQKSQIDRLRGGVAVSGYSPPSAWSIASRSARQRVRSARSTAVISDNRQRRDLFADALAGAKGRLNPKGILNPGVLLPAPA
jgi:hypothetical protein